MRKIVFLIFFFVVVTALLSVPPAKRLKTPAGEVVLPSQEVLEILGKPYINALADFYWILTSYTVGGASDRLSYLEAYYYGDLVVRLDPDFEYAYLFVGQSIPYNEGGLERWVNAKEALDILERGHARFPNNLALRIQLAFNYSYHQRRYKDAADPLEDTRKLPNAPPYLPQLITRLYAQSGHIDKAMGIAELLYETAQYDDEREAYAKRILEIRLEGVLQAVEQARDAFKSREGRAPQDVSELVAVGDLPEAPSDPMGGEIYLSKEDGRAYSTAQERRLEIYRSKPIPMPGYEDRVDPVTGLLKEDIGTSLK